MAKKKSLPGTKAQRERAFRKVAKDDPHLTKSQLAGKALGKVRHQVKKSRRKK